ncbi:MAG: helix-turn-helix transcriptional regulator [Cyanobacteriota bacterium]
MKILYQWEEDGPGLEDWLREAVEASDKSVTAIAAEAGITSSYLYRLMSGRQPAVSEGVLRRLEAALGKRYMEGDRCE